MLKFNGAAGGGAADVTVTSGRAAGHLRVIEQRSPEVRDSGTGGGPGHSAP